MTNSRHHKLLIFFLLLFGCFSVGIHIAKANSCLSTGSGGNYNVAASWTTCGGVAPKNTDTIEIASGAPITMIQATTTAGVIIDSGATLTGSTFLLTDTGNYINNGTHNGTGGVTVNGASAVIGGTGATTNSGTFTISGATAPSFSSTSTLTITGGLTMSGPVTITTGAVITELGVTAISGGIKITNNGTFNASSTSGITGTLTSSTWAQGSNSTLNFSGGTTTLLSTGTLTATSTGNTVNYNEATAQTCKVVQYYHLTLSGGGIKTCAPTSPLLGNLIYSGVSTWTMTTALTVDGTLSVSGSGGTVTTGAVAFIVNGTTTISNGTLSLTNSTGAKTLTGLVTLSGGTLSGAATTIGFGAGIANNAGTVTITGSSTFSTSGATLSGADLITIGQAIVTSPGTVINNGTTTLSAATALSGTGSWTQAASSTLNISATTAAPISITTFDAHTNNNVVNYSGAAQTCFTTQYYNLTISGTGTKTCTPTSPVVGNLIYSGTGAWTMTTALTVNGTFALSNGTVTTGAVAFTVAGATTISAGTLSLTNSTGAKTLTGLVTLSGGTLSGAATSTVFGAGIENDAGTVTITGSSTFSTAGATLSGTNLITLGYVAVTSPGTVTNNATAAISGVLSGSGSWTQTTSSVTTFSLTGTPISISTFDTNNSSNTVNFSGAAQTCFATQYYNLTFSGSGAKTCAPTSPTLGNVIMTGTATWTETAAETVDGTLTLSGGSLTTAGFAFTVDGATNISAGTLSLTNSTGAKTLVGMVTLNGSSPTLSGAATSTIFGAGITNTSGTVSITGSSTFSTAGATLSGADLISLGYVAVTADVTSIATTTISGILSGNGSWIQATSSVLNLSFTGTPISISTFDANNSSNTVNFSGAAQTCNNTQYYNLTISGSGTKTCAPTSPLLGNLIYSGSGAWTMTTALVVNGNASLSTGTMTLGGTFEVDGNLTINSGILDDAAGHNYAINLLGNFINNGTFTARAGTVTLGGSNEQQLSGTMTGSSAFYNLTITNNSGVSPTDCEITSFTPSVAFLAGASSTNTYTITTGGNVGVQYNNGSSYSFVNTDWVGPSGQPIYFRNSAAGTGTWLVSVSGTQTPLAYINVSRSDASGGGSISAGSITNTDCGNNTNWAFGSNGLTGSAYTQIAYRWFSNQNSTQVGATLAATNASTTLTSTGEAFRLRMLLAVDASTSVSGVDSFALQFAKKGTGSSCASPQFSYANVTTATAIAYNNNASISDGDLLTPTSSDPVDGGRTVVEQTYQEANNFTVTSTISVGEDGNWDFSLIDDGPGGTDYCFQAVFSSSTALYAYPVYPEIMTAASPASVISNIVFNSGNPSITLLPNTSTTITVAASATDPGGAGNIISATSTIYRTSLGGNCSANNLNCYQIGASQCIFSGSTSTVTCSANLWYFVQSTGVPSSSFPSDSWSGAITVTNGQGYATTATSTPQNVNVLTAINVSTSSINYGILTPGLNTGSTNQVTTIINAGNSSSSIQLSGTAFINGANSIATSSQHYASSSFTFGGAEQQLSDTLTTVSGFTLTDPTSTSNVQGSIFWGDQVPLNVPKGTYTATTTITAVFSQ